MLAGRDLGNDERPAGSFLQLDHSEVELVHLASSRRGHDLVAVLHSQADEPIEVGVDFGSLPWPPPTPDRSRARLRPLDGHDG